MSLTRSLRRLALAAPLSCGAASTPSPPAASAVPPAAESAPAPTPPDAPTGRLQVDVGYHKLDNGLKVVLSRDTAAPIATIAVYYNIGFRTEPMNRTGFAHLFEHMMFQGSQNLGKMAFMRLVNAHGGVLDGATRSDFTKYFEVVPVNTVETILWAEADRMRGLAITQENLTNQQSVVKNEVKSNVLNTPYGGFPWLDVPQVANENWYNAHNFYGEFKDIDATTLEEVKAFFDTYYAPNNAVVVVVGDIDPAQTLSWIQRYFGGIPGAPQPKRPDVAEPRQEKEKRASKTDALAPRPALAVAYHVPPRNTPEYYAMGLLNVILLQGKDSRLYQALVQRRGLTGSVSGGINVELGHMFNVKGPTLWTAYLIHDADKPTDTILSAIDEEIERLRREPVDRATLELALIKVRSSLYDTVGATYGIGRADLLACFALLDDDPRRINQIEDGFARVTPELLLATAREYLRPTNRTVLTVVPGATAEPDAGGAPGDREAEPLGPKKKTGK
jgi:zinc protease